MVLVSWVLSIVLLWCPLGLWISRVLAGKYLMHEDISASWMSHKPGKECLGTLFYWLCFREMLLHGQCSGRTLLCTIYSSHTELEWQVDPNWMGDQSGFNLVSFVDTKVGWDAFVVWKFSSEPQSNVRARQFCSWDWTCYSPLLAIWGVPAVVASGSN